MAKLLDSTGNQLPDELKVAIASGKVHGWSAFRKFGSNDDIDGGPEDIWSAGGTRTLPSSAGTVSVSSDSAADDGSPEGTGAHTVFLDGLDADYMPQTETLTLNGTTTVTSANSYIRLDRAYVLAAGSGEVNAGDITFSIGGNTQALIAAGAGQTSVSGYTVPADRFYFVTYYLIRVGRLGTDTVSVQAQFRLGAGDLGQSWRNLSDLHLNESGHSNDAAVTIIPPKTDLRIRATTNGNNRRVAAIHGGYHCTLAAFNSI